VKQIALKFADFFAGLGGFHVGLSRLGHRCVMSCEIEPELVALYERNFGLKPKTDIRTLTGNDVPEHDLLCAGFPCQPFSKAGEQLGLACDKDGDLFAQVVKVLGWRRPQMVLLENVANLLKHDGGRTYARMSKKLRSLGYAVDQKVLSPHKFGIPQVRDRLFIVGTRGGLHDFRWPEPMQRRPHISAVLDQSPADAKLIPKHYADCLAVWQEFLDQHTADIELPSFPIWSMEFGADYPYRGDVVLSPRGLSRYCGSHGKRLKDLLPDQRLNAIPSYARNASFPRWKQDFIRQNRELYNRNKRWIDRWKRKITQFPPSLQKLEWNCKGERRLLTDHIVQFRASGVRVKRSESAPALIAMTTTQVPIIAAEGRYMTVRECSRLQGLGGLEHFPEAATKAYRALGNAVNADLVQMIAQRLIAATYHRGAAA